VFVSNVNKSVQAVKEALTAGVFSIGIVDTDTKAHFVSLPIPSNDESNVSINFFNLVVANCIILNKFKIILDWYLNIRSNNRVLKMYEVVQDFISLKKDIKIFSPIFSGFSNTVKSLRLLFAFDFKRGEKISKAPIFLSKVINALTFESFKCLNEYRNFFSSMIRVSFFSKRNIKNGKMLKVFLNYKFLKKYKKIKLVDNESFSNLNSVYLWFLMYLLKSSKYFSAGIKNSYSGLYYPKKENTILKLNKILLGGVFFCFFKGYCLLPLKEVKREINSRIIKKKEVKREINSRIIKKKEVKREINSKVIKKKEVKREINSKVIKINVGL
jgi:hypothetical protein